MIILACTDPFHFQSPLSGGDHTTGYFLFTSSHKWDQIFDVRKLYLLFFLWHVYEIKRHSYHFPYGIPEGLWLPYLFSMKIPRIFVIIFLQQ